MKKLCLLLCFFCSLPGITPGQASDIFDDSHVSRIYLSLPADSLLEMLAELENNHYYRATFVFDDGSIRDTVENAGLRLRGNTSLSAQKKSFKISFNAYEAGREYQGVRKLNLLGSHNDPTMIREKLFYEVWESSGMPIRRGSFTRLFINNEYKGLYANLEEIDKQWLKRTFGDDSGNLYKCTYPADLAYLGDDPATYKAIMNNPESRAYDLVTNETEDDYTRLLLLIKTLNQPVNAAFANNISAILHVETVLKALALDVATGNWDDYFYNKNNYYLYDNPVTGRFEFVTYDTDNSFGVDWLGKDWAKRNCLQWLPSQQPRPLASKLLAVPAFFQQYVHYLDSFSQSVVHPNVIFPRIDALHQLITPAAQADTYRSLDWGYDLADFHNGFTQTIDNHTPYGIKPFLAIRYDSTMRQIAHLLSGTADPAGNDWQMSVFPNPATEWVEIKPAANDAPEMLFGSIRDCLGRSLQNWHWHSSSTYSLSLKNLPPGTYSINIHSSVHQGNWLLAKR